MGAVRHTFTHFHLTVQVLVLDGEGIALGEGQWWPVVRIEEAGLPSLFLKAARLAISA